MKTARDAAAVICAAVLLVACSAPQVLRPADIRPVNHSTGRLNLERIDGLRAALASSPQAPVRLLALHGMITNAASYSMPMQEALAARLGFVRLGDPVLVELHRGYEFVPSFGPQPLDGVARLPTSQLRRTAWGPSAGGTERLVVHELLWAPLRDQVKNAFVACFERGIVGSSADCKPFSRTSPNGDPRLIVNKALKDTITLGGFADATLVLGPIGDVIRDDVTLALCVLASEVLRGGSAPTRTAHAERCNLAAQARPIGLGAAGLALANTRFFTLTHSLGSFLFMDAQQAYVEAAGEFESQPTSQQEASCRLDRGRCDELEQAQLLFWLLDRSTVFMNANQVSLLALARLSPSACRPAAGQECPNPYLRRRQRAGEPWERPTGMSRMTVYVAFNDTNDLLGFEVPPFMGDVDGGFYINVSVDNPAFTVPWLFKSPAGAHTQQADNKALVHAIVEGLRIPQRD